MSKLIGGKIIGKGNYGCVHKPQMECDDDTETKPSADSVSKIMLDTDATKEMTEFIAVANADSLKRIHLGTPIKCAIKNTEDNKDAIKECNISRPENIAFDKTKLGNYALLVMKDGGQDLTTFGEVIRIWDNNTENQNKMELFWLEVSRLFYGLKVFKDAGLVHHDINQNNIVYNIDTNRLNFIDFGHMTNPTNIIENTFAGRGYPRWWSLPWEITDFGPSKYNTYLKANYSYMPPVMPPIANEYEYDKFFKLILPNVQGEELALIKTKMSHEYNTQTKSYTNHNKKEQLNKSIKTRDSYGVGIALLYILNRSRHLIDLFFGYDLHALFTNMISPLVAERHDVDTLIAKYNKIMTDSGFLEKHKKHYDENFLLVNDDEDPPALPAIVNDDKDPPALPAIVNDDDEDPPALPDIIPGGRHRHRTRKSYKMSKSMRYNKSSKRVRARKAHKAKRSHKKR